MKDSMRIYNDVPLCAYTTFGIGGKADKLIEVCTVQSLSHVLQEERATFVLGGGSNLLISDAGFKGTVIKCGLRDMQRQGNTVVAGCGVSLSSLARFASVNELGGLEWAACIPGTVGGAVKMNAGAHGKDISQTLAYADVFTAGKTVRLTPDCCGFGYRRSDFDGVVISAAFCLKQRDKREILENMDDFRAKRRAAQPVGRSAGSVFKAVNGVPAYKFIEGAGLKGLRKGGAQVSQKHANFILNTGGATAADVIALVCKIQSEVYGKYGVVLEREIILVGEF